MWNTVFHRCSFFFLLPKVGFPHGCFDLDVVTDFQQASLFQVVIFIPAFLLKFPLPWMISCENLYFSFLIMSLDYSSFLHFMHVVISLSLFTLVTPPFWSQSWSKTFLASCNKSTFFYLFHLSCFRVHASVLYSILWKILDRCVKQITEFWP